MTLALPRDLDVGENNLGALNFFECPCMGEDTIMRCSMMYEKEGPFPQDPDDELTDS